MMKVKEIECTANLAWSPATQHPVYIVGGTAAQQLDATFSTSASLDLYELDFSVTGLEMPKKASINTEHRFHKLVWSSHVSDDMNTLGTIAGGADNGHISLYNASNILNGSNGLSHHMTKHSGIVGALDFNHFQNNLLASGANESEIFIWDLNNLANPMAPGAKSQPLETINCLAWNKQVQHILASTSPGGRCIVWDLRKSEPIIKVTDQSMKIHLKAVAWHPEVATQMVIASEDDHLPIIQMWDLRFATSPLKVLEGHQRGILSIAWCPQDPDLLLSCGKDNRVLCWNPNTTVAGGEIVYELPNTSQWCFDVQWCPRNPALISTASFDGHICVYSLLGGDNQKPNPQLENQQNKLSTSFPGAVISQMQQPQEPSVKIPLKKPPKWMRRPVGANFCFGGKLVSFNMTKPSSHHPSQQNKVYISQVVTENELIERSNQLQTALLSGDYADFCDSKITSAKSEIESTIWNFLKGNFDKNPRSKFLDLLGYSSHNLAKKVAELMICEPLDTSSDGVDATELVQKIKGLTTSGSTSDIAILGSGTTTPTAGSKTPENLGAATFDAITAQGPIEISSTMETESRPDSPYIISTKGDTDGLITQALLTGNFEAAVNMCILNDRMTDAILLSFVGGPELLAQTQKVYFQKAKNNISRLISAVVNRDWADIVRCCDLDNWKEALAIILTYASPTEFSPLCEILGNRLETEKMGNMSSFACLCYICAGNIDKLVSCWSKNLQQANSPEALQDIIEKIMILRKTVEMIQGKKIEITGEILANKMNEYAFLLATQGNLYTAITYLVDSNKQSILEMRERLYKALGNQTSQISNPQFALKKDEMKLKENTSPIYHQQKGINSSFQTSTVSSSQYLNYHGNVPIMNNHQQHYVAYNQSDLSQKPQPSTVMPKSSVFQNQPSLISYPSTTPVTSSSSSGKSVNNLPLSYPVANTSNLPPSYLASSSTVSPGAPFQQTNQSQALSVNQTGWNDTPLIKPKKQTPTSYIAPQPITTPLYGGGYIEEQEVTPPSPVNQVAPGGPSSEPQEMVSQVEKPPIPSEHLILVETFDTLAKKCATTAKSPQTKRKVEDVNKRLLVLYEKLRENCLTSTVLNGLHAISQSINNVDYHNGLAIHSQLIQSGNFSEIGTFMPGLKVLMQVATQLQIR